MNKDELIIRRDLLSRTIDLSAVRPGVTAEEVRDLVEFAKKINCTAVFTFPSFTKLAIDLLADEPDIIVGGVVGFPAGATTTITKVNETYELIGMGCREIDMVINFGMIRSGMWKQAYKDIKAVVEAAGEIPVKVIFECHYLSDEQIKHSCDISIEGGASFVKTGTGWAPTGATLRNIALIKAHVGNSIGIKAAGGIRDLDTLLELYRRGARRFGIGIKTGASIFKEIEHLPKAEIHMPPYNMN